MKLIFLGTGGGRFATINQERMTGGFRIDGFADKNFHVDPGPGALVRLHDFGLNPGNLDVLFISHSHADHYNDGEIIVEAMTEGMSKQNGLIVGSKSILEGYKQWGPCISNYHKSKSNTLVLSDNQSINLNGFTIKGTKTMHGDPTGIGFQLKSDDLTISYTSDTGYFDTLHKYHKGADILIASVLRPKNKFIKYRHMSSSQLIELINEVKPKLTIMTHYGLKMINAPPENEAKNIEKKTGRSTIAAFDGMSLTVNDKNANDFNIETLKKKIIKNK
ncbi:MAG: MBL fold metallo-hydrolase [Methanobrevibacter sp.]|jgi:ribonuclease BN (tRNA processing enzyme)|nr:MBL fold metallo-hydrolase [Methanobrevibacter sp.]